MAITGKTIVTIQPQSYGQVIAPYVANPDRPLKGLPLSDAKDKARRLRTQLEAAGLTGCLYFGITIDGEKLLLS